ncbi:cobalamin biosynthesis protein CobW [Nocardioides albidus]|uniref:Cobalamin biosynthesis protein CobW n=1 Tax=Nocardioides albidus TaxID=1517589 RepID=A0A5C4VPG0_9ACTN|nr:GTP-binding protein [Nocardioides albidus]TNM37730.1 cobalamin biosynthesis protein CobW [Nocardioides albidus]
MRTPLLVITGVDPVAMDSALMSLAWDLPRAVSVRHRIDPHSQLLTRTVSDASGLLEQEQIQLEHACVSCALREDIMPTLERLARDDRWSAIVSGLPTATEAGQLAHILATDGRLARHLKLSAVLAAVGTGDVVRDLLSDDLLRERDVHTNPDDDRGVGEVACAQIEYADIVVLDADPGAEAADLVHALARPEIPVIVGAAQLDAAALTAQRHQSSLNNTWCSPEFDADLPTLESRHAWRLDLSSPRPFHPDRLLDQIERLGTGPYRSRGSFWVPTRPGDLLEWSGAGGQLSIGGYSPWGRRTPMTRLIFTGLGEAPTELAAAFEDMLLTPTEALLDRHSWDVLEDGLEPWLGDIRDVA